MINRGNLGVEGHLGVGNGIAQGLLELPVKVLTSFRGRITGKVAAPMPQFGTLAIHFYTDGAVSPIPVSVAGVVAESVGGSMVGKNEIHSVMDIIAVDESESTGFAGDFFHGLLVLVRA